MLPQSELGRAAAMGGGLAGLPSLVVGVPPILAKSTEEHTHPLREIDVMGFPDFFDHSGNTINGHVAAEMVLWLGVVVGNAVEKRVSEGAQVPVIITISATAGAVGTAANVAHEAGVYVPPNPPKSPQEGFDPLDALTGSLAAIFTAGSFCFTALKLRQIRRREEKQAKLNWLSEA